jgi:cell division protein ZipA
MDISIRDWMIIIGVLLIVAVLLDGYRRMRNGAGQVRVSLAPAPVARDGDADAEVVGELPNGGARVVYRDDDDDGTEGNEPPLLTESATSPPLAQPVPELNLKPELESEPMGGVRASAHQPGETLDLLAGISSGDQAPLSDAATIDSEVLMLHVVARDETGFAGEDILQILLAFELRFGEMNFFHGHQEAAGRGAIQFSVANMLHPGVFDIDAMSNFTTPGLIFFLTLPGPVDMMAAFDQMSETARGVAEHLGGDLLDESRSVATRQTLDHMRQRVRDLERRMLTQPSRQG